ncbi:MAG: hypothetical protein HYZ88_00165 [Candidatus Omnitrophica bacterium]|nr:hypothetical protein [Candidatus Omnitrophota bacterium]
MMKSLRYGVIACLVVALWPGLSFGQEEGSQANTNSPPTLQVPYGQDKAQSRVDQGNNGRPVMRDPYGKDKDRNRLETGNQGRPIPRGTESKNPESTGAQNKEQRKETARDDQQRSREETSYHDRAARSATPNASETRTQEPTSRTSRPTATLTETPPSASRGSRAPAPSVEAPASSSRPTMREPYGLDKDDRKAMQGNRGRPIMGDPFGQLEDKSQIEGKEHGRPFRTPVAEPIPEPAPEPTPEPTPEPAPEPTPEPTPAPAPEPVPVIELPAPSSTKPQWSVASGGWNVAVTPETLCDTRNYTCTPGQRYLTTVKGLTWLSLIDQRITGFRVYEQRPGESEFHVYRSIDLASTGIGSQDYTSTYFLSPEGYTMTLVSYKQASGETAVTLLEWRIATAWSRGTYRYAVVAYDAKGQEGPKGVVVSTTNLGEIQMLRPTEGQALERNPAFQWSNVWADMPASVTSQMTYPTGYGRTELIVSESGRGLWHPMLNRDTTSALYWFGYDWTGIRGGYALVPGQRYYIVVMTLGSTPDDAYIATSPLTGFTVE